jgi:hypothetical protein
MTSLSFEYHVNITAGANSLKAGPFANGMPGCGEIMIASKVFPTYEECEQNLHGLLGTLSIVEASLSDKNFVIVTKTNPNLDTSGKKHADADTWDARTMMRAYVADADALKEKYLKYHVIGNIRLTESQVEELQLTTSQSAQ